MTDWRIKNKHSNSALPVLLLPGWGFSGEILAEHPVFAEEPLVYSQALTHPDLLDGLVGFLEAEEVDQLCVLGWSMGGNLALDFLDQHPGIVSSLTLVSVRQSWGREDIELTRKGLFDATGKGMATFYRKCFLGTKDDLAQLKFSAQELDVALLDAGLSYLADFTMPDMLPLPVHRIQGDKDVICPVTEMVHFSSQTTTTICTGAGHFLFSHPDFKL